MRRIIACLVALVVTVGTAAMAQRPGSFPAAKTVALPKAKHNAHFHPRYRLYRSNPFRRFKLPAGWQQPSLPIDRAVKFTYPILGNDQWGDCGPVANAHLDQAFTGLLGKASAYDQSALVAQYLGINGGDYGTSEPDLVGPKGIWMRGLAGATPAGAVALDHIDLDPNDLGIVYAAIGYFGGAQLAFSVPDRWIQEFQPDGSTVWDVPAVPDPNNGHYVALVGVRANGNLVAATWGSTVDITPAGLKQVDPAIFAVFSARQFDATGKDWHGYSWDQKVSLWKAGGGSDVGPDPFPPPGPTPPPPTPPSPAPAGFTGMINVKGGLVLDQQGVPADGPMVFVDGVLQTGATPPLPTPPSPPNPPTPPPPSGRWTGTFTIDWNSGKAVARP